MKINRISPDKHKYLQITESIAKKPEKLFYMGRLPPGRIPSVAIVGARKPTSYGKEVGHYLAYELAKRGIIIISGLALGIDAIAHRGALEAGGTTIAILGNGLPGIYPSAHKMLAKEILEKNGALITEYEPETSARQYHFLARNRIVSGLADAVIVVEATAKSGTLNTAAHATEQGKAVFAVPGHITSPLSAGCNALIKRGAFPITSFEDVLEVIAPENLQPQTSLALGSTPLETKIIQLLQSGIRDGDQLQQLAEVSAAEFAQTLTIMEIHGVIRGLGANQWTLR